MKIPLVTPINLNKEDKSFGKYLLLEIINGEEKMYIIRILLEVAGEVYHNLIIEDLSIELRESSWKLFENLGGGYISQEEGTVSLFGSSSFYGENKDPDKSMEILRDAFKGYEIKYWPPSTF